MSDEQSMSVKAYLSGANGRQEVRRFGMPENLATNFSALKDKVCNVFSIRSQDIVISWKDSDGDSIIISSDEELVEAIADSLSKQKMQVFRINIAFRDDTSQGNQDGDCHEGVTCDGCGGNVIGFRYKCVTCPDFDLCGSCEAKGVHKEHKMIRMPKARGKGEPNFWWKENEGPGGQFSTQFGMNQGMGPGMQAGMGSGVHTGMGTGDGNAFSFSSSSTVPGAPQNGSWCGWGPWMGRGGRHCNRNGGRGHGGWRGWWGKNWGGAGGNAGGGCWQGQGQTMGGSSSQQQQQQQQQQQSSQREKSQEKEKQKQSSNGNSNQECPWTSTNGGSCPFSAEGNPIPSPERVAEEVHMAAHEAHKMAHDVAHHFASQMATEHVANVMKGIWTAWSGQQPPGVGPSSSSTHSESFSSSSSTNGNENKKAESQFSFSSTNGNENKKAEGIENPNQQSRRSSNGGSPQEQFLKSVGDNVANILEPLGIDVDVSVEHNGIRQRCSLSKDDLQNRQSPTSRTPNAGTPPPQLNPPSVAKSSANVMAQTETRDESPSEMEVNSPAGAEVQMESDAEDWTMVNRDTQTPEGRSDRDTQTPEGRSEAKPKTTTTTSQTRVQYPDLQELRPHPDPKIQRALEQMQAMGYHNEGGWLTNILEMKQGDINQVLDMLQPFNK